MKIFNQFPTHGPIQSNRLGLGSPDKLRFTIGLLGMLLPLILYVGTGFQILGSVSAYYFTDMQWAFVGYFVLLGIFLLAYKGFPGSYDDHASTVAGILSILVAVFHTAPPQSNRELIGWLHMIFASSFLLVIVYMTIFLFPLKDQFHWKHIIYRTCGVLMIISAIGIAYSFLTNNLPIAHPTFWFEIIGFEAFGIAWIFKSL